MLTSIGHFKNTTMDTAKVLPKCFPVLEIFRMWVAAIKPDPGAMEPNKEMDCMDVTVGRFLVGETSPAAVCQAIIVLGGGTSFHPSEVLMVRVQVQGMSHP